MRVNVYDSDITGEVERELRTVRVGEELIDFIGIRIFLLSPQRADEDRSAVTFWFREGSEQSLIDLLNTAEHEASYD